MAEFDRSSAKVLVSEGGYTNNQKDTGGANMTANPQITLGALVAKRVKIQSAIAAEIEADVAAVLSGAMPSRSARLTELCQDLNIFDAAIERLRKSAA
jgi:lysozyme family protein